MTAPLINLARLRSNVERGIAPRPDDVFALVEAVEAAQEVTGHDAEDAPLSGEHGYLERWARLHAALAVFEESE